MKIMLLSLRSVLLLSFVAISTISSSQVSRPPKHIFGFYGERVQACSNMSSDNGKFDCDGELANTLLILPVATSSGSDAWVDIHLHFHNGHDCGLQGHGKWVVDRIKVEPRFDADTCELQIHFKKGNAILSEDGRCRSLSCGARGVYDGISLRKRGSI